jgi:hypothetical protein
LRDALLQADVTRNIAGEKWPANVGGVLPISFCGGPDRVVEQIRRCREEIGAGVLDLSLQDPGTGDVGAMMRALELFGKKVLPASARFELKGGCASRAFTASLG